MENEKKTPVPKNLTAYLNDLMIFGEQINNRTLNPENPKKLYYSEVLLNQKEYENYIEAEKKLRGAIRRLENYFQKREESKS